DNIIDDEDALPHNLTDFDDEDLINVDDDGKGKRRANLGGRVAGRLNTRQKTLNHSLNEIMDTKDPVLIRFEVRDKQTLMPLGEMLPKFSQIVNRLYAFIYETNHSKSGLGLPSIVALVMVIDDKSWTLFERHEPAFYIGLEKFVNHCKPLLNNVGKIRCPCKSCRTILWVSIKHLSDHIIRHGFDLGYKIWLHHGKPDLPPTSSVKDNTRQRQMSDMTTLLNDLSYSPPNNEHNDPTQGDIGEISNEPTQDTRNEFEELYASANEELYPGCDCVTQLDFMAKFTYFKVKGKLTDSIFNEMLEFFQNVFPISNGYKLPPSYHAIKNTFKTTGLGAWKNFDTKYLDFAKEPRNVRVGLAADGFNPFGNLSQAYIMWLVILTTYNLPPWLCMKESYFMLTLLILGPKSPGKDIDVYLRPLIEDLKFLWDRKGVETINVASGQKFNMRAMVLWTINNFPPRSSLSGWSGQGYKACSTCNKDTPSVRVLRKTTYVGHIRFLKKPHKWKSSLESNGDR
nr:hypothetical protein [Tanacetum cinerariifolium]